MQEQLALEDSGDHCSSILTSDTSITQEERTLSSVAPRSYRVWHAVALYAASFLITLVYVRFGDYETNSLLSSNADTGSLYWTGAWKGQGQKYQWALWGHGKRHQLTRRQLEQLAPAGPHGDVFLKRQLGNQIYVPCGLKFKPPREPAEVSSHEDFFDGYRDVHREEADRYNITQIAGKGSYGVVAEAIDSQTGELVAIKKMVNVFTRRSDALRNLRELKLLRVMTGFDDIVQIRHVLLPLKPHSFTTIFFVMELMDTDLREVIRLSKYLSPETQKVVLFQMVRGMHQLHRANIYHRDMKPSNILVNSNCKVKICDFSLARPVFNNTPELQAEWTGYVATRWYRPPELCLAKFTRWTRSMDVWGIGCIFLEVALGRPLFPGSNAEEQLGLITDLLGTPPLEVLEKYPAAVQEKIKQMGLKPERGLANTFPWLPREVLAIASKMLDLDPEDRPTPKELLEDSFFEDIVDLPVGRGASAVSGSDLAFPDRRGAISLPEMRHFLLEEIMTYHPGKGLHHEPHPAWHGNTTPAPSARRSDA